METLKINALILFAMALHSATLLAKQPLKSTSVNYKDAPIQGEKVGKIRFLFENTKGQIEPLSGFRVTPHHRFSVVGHDSVYSMPTDHNGEVHVTAKPGTCENKLFYIFPTTYDHGFTLLDAPSFEPLSFTFWCAHDVEVTIQWNTDSGQLMTIFKTLTQGLKSLEQAGIGFSMQGYFQNGYFKDDVLKDGFLIPAQTPSDRIPFIIEPEHTIGTGIECKNRSLSWRQPSCRSYGLKISENVFHWSSQLLDYDQLQTKLFWILGAALTDITQTRVLQPNIPNGKNYHCQSELDGFVAGLNLFISMWIQYADSPEAYPPFRIGQSEPNIETVGAVDCKGLGTPSRVAAYFWDLVDANDDGEQLNLKLPEVWKTIVGKNFSSISRAHEALLKSGVDAIALQKVYDLNFAK